MQVTHNLNDVSIRNIMKVLLFQIMNHYFSKFELNIIGDLGFGLTTVIKLK